MSTRWGFNPKARQIRETVDWLIPVACAIDLVDQWVASAGVSSKVFTMIRSTSSSVTVRGAPGRGSSWSHILRLKESGLLRFPFADLAANRAWLFVVALSADLVRWFQLLCLEGTLATARPKALRWSFLHAPGRLVRRGRRLVIRVLHHWPSAEDIVRAHRRIAASPEHHQPRRAVGPGWTRRAFHTTSLDEMPPNEGRRDLTR